MSVRQLSAQHCQRLPCRKCRRLSDGKEFAVKIVSQKFSHQALREIRILELVTPHENIVKMEEAMSDQLHYYIVLELLQGGELLQRLRRMNTFIECQASSIMAQLVGAVSHLHSKSVVHRDLKPEVSVMFVICVLRLSAESLLSN